MTDQRKRILAVDDDPNVLGGLQRVLRPLRGEWDMVFMESPRKALERLGQESFHVVMSDLKMGEMDGPEFLLEVKRVHPKTCTPGPLGLHWGRTDAPMPGGEPPVHRRVDQTTLNLVGVRQNVRLLAKPFSLRELQAQLEGLGLT